MGEMAAQDEVDLIEVGLEVAIETEDIIHTDVKVGVDTNRGKEI